MLKFVTLTLCAFAVWAEAANLKRIVGPTTRIIGGEPARAGQFPFAAAIYKSTSNGKYFCGGTIINRQWILTAGQCVEDAVLFTIILAHNPLDTEHFLATEHWALHPEYNPNTLVHDVGLIKLRMEISYTQYCHPLDGVWTTPLDDYTGVTTIGWGQTGDNNPDNDELRFVHLATLSNEECRLTYGSAVTDEMVCVAGNFNEGTCLGDVGSPLIWYSDHSFHTYHVGISTFISGNGCESTDPSGFTRSAPYIDWIDAVVANETLFY